MLNVDKHAHSRSILHLTNDSNKIYGDVRRSRLLNENSECL